MIKSNETVICIKSLLTYDYIKDGKYLTIYVTDYPDVIMIGILKENGGFTYFYRSKTRSLTKEEYDFDEYFRTIPDNRKYKISQIQ